MRILVTPLGGAGRSAAQTARRIREYLEGKPVPTIELLDPGPPPSPPEHPAPPPRFAEPPPAPPQIPSGVECRLVRYYSDSMEGPGRWLGLGAAELGLVGPVNGDDLEAVLAGRHPATGERLVGAQGSSGRRHLAAGTAARYSTSGEAMFTIADTATLLKVSKAVVVDMIAEGDCLHPDHNPPLANWIRASPGTGDHRLVAATEIERWTTLTERGVTAHAVERTGQADDWLSAPEAARLVGVSAQYVRRLCQRFIDNPARFTAGKSSVEWIACTAEPAARGSQNKVAYRIRRSELVAFTTRRRRPVVRCGFDLTLTTEKSFGVLMMLSDPDVRAVFEAALDAGNAVAIRYLEQHGTFTRANGQRVATTGLTVATYLHGTSRALDPFPHRHNIVANTALDANGDRKTLDARGFYEQAPVAAALGLTPTALAACTPGPTLEVPDLTAPISVNGQVRAVGLVADIFSVLAGPDGLTGPVNWFTRGDVIRTLVDHNIGDETNPQPLLLPAAQMEKLADTFLLSDQIIELHPDAFATRTGEPRFTTVDLLETQEAIHHRYHHGRTANIGLVPNSNVDQAIVDTAIEHGHDLSADQEELVRWFCGSGMQIPWLGPWPQPRIDPDDSFVAFLEPHVPTVRLHSHALHQRAVVPVVPRLLAPHEPRRVPMDLMKRHCPLATPR